MTVSKEALRPTRSRSLATIILASMAFVVVVVALNGATKTLFAGSMASSLRARVTVELTAAMVGEIIVLALLVLFLRRRDVSLRQLGL